MRTLLVLAIHLVTKIAKLLGPGGARGLLPETVLVRPYGTFTRSAFLIRPADNNN